MIRVSDQLIQHLNLTYPSIEISRLPIHGKFNRRHDQRASRGSSSYRRRYQTIRYNTRVLKQDQVAICVNVEKVAQDNLSAQRGYTTSSYDAVHPFAEGCHPGSVIYSVSLRVFPICTARWLKYRSTVYEYRLSSITCVLDTNGGGPGFPPFSF